MRLTLKGDAVLRIYVSREGTFSSKLVLERRLDQDDNTKILLPQLNRNIPEKT